MRVARLIAFPTADDERPAEGNADGFDHLAKPMLVNEALRMDAVIVFVAALGGLYASAAPLTWLP